MRTARHRWIAAFLPAILLFATAAAQSGGSPSAESQVNPPQLQFVFEEYVTLAAPIHPGATPFGERNIVPITGGVFTGPKISGKVMPGGWDWQLATKTGCFSLSASYMLQAEDGAIIHVLNQGTFCKSFSTTSRLFTTPEFEAPLGPHQWLNSGAYIGTLDSTTFQGKPAVHIRFYQAL